MSMPVRLPLSRKRGFNLQALSRVTNGLDAVRVSRPGVFGNPFTIAHAREVGYQGTDDQMRAMAVECFRSWAGGSSKWWMGPESDTARQALLDALPALRDKNLACWCKPGQTCHADVLLEMAGALA